MHFDQLIIKTLWHIQEIVYHKKLFLKLTFNFSCFLPFFSINQALQKTNDTHNKELRYTLHTASHTIKNILKDIS